MSLIGKKIKFSIDTGIYEIGIVLDKISTSDTDKYIIRSEEGYLYNVHPDRINKIIDDEPKTQSDSLKQSDDEQIIMDELTKLGYSFRKSTDENNKTIWSVNKNGYGYQTDSIYKLYSWLMVFS